MIRKSKVKIYYDPVEFPDERYDSYHECYTADYLCSKFEDKFADKLCLYDDIVICKDMTVKLSGNEGNKVVRAYSSDYVSIKLHYADRFIKRVDLLPYFTEAYECDDHVIVDGHCFANFTMAFHSMFTVNDNKIIPKPWKPEHIIASLLDLHSNKLETLGSQAARLTVSLKTTKKKLKQTTTELEQTTAKLEQTTTKLEQTTTELEQTTAKLEQIKGKLHQIEEQVPISEL